MKANGISNDVTNNEWNSFDFFQVLEFFEGKKGVAGKWEFWIGKERSKRHKGWGPFSNILSARLWQSRAEDVSLVYHFRVPELHVLGNVRALWVYYLQNNRFLEERGILFALHPCSKYHFSSSISVKYSILGQTRVRFNSFLFSRGKKLCNPSFSPI